MMPMLNSLMLCCLSLAVGDKPAAPAETPTQVLIVGMVHLGNPGLDLLNPEIKGILGERRQKEIQEVVDRLKAFHPTKIAVEATPGSAKLQQRLNQYLAGKYKLTPDERDQIGLCLAKELKQTLVYGIDFPEDLPFDNVIGYAEKNGQGALWQRVMSEVETKLKPKLAAERLEKESIREILLKSNTPEADAIGQRIYFGLLRIGKGKEYPGADLVSRWYDRNLHIATNIARLSENPGERILVLIGSGHGKLLRQFLSEMPGMEVVGCTDYL